MKFRNTIGWGVALAYVLAGRRAAICRRCRRENLIVPVLMHGPDPERLDQILLALDGLVGLDRVELTFDDGRRVLEDCIPVLEKYQIPATFFISPGEILRGYNWAECRGLPSMPDFGVLCRMDEASRTGAVERARRKAGLDGRTSELLSVERIRALAGHPLVNFGNHTWSHMSCANRPIGEVLDEIDRAQRQIAEWTGKTPTRFSYPFGHDSAELDEVIRAHGLTPYCLRPGLVDEATRGRARNMAYEDLSVAENVGRLLTAWPRVRRMPA